MGSAIVGVGGATVMPSVIVLDNYYPDFLRTIPEDPDESYDQALARVLSYNFGTGDFYSRHLADLGWRTADVIVNSDVLQAKWKKENPWSDPTPTNVQIALKQIETFEPDVVFLQDLSLFTVEQLQMLGERYVLAGQCSCPMPPAVYIRELDALFTSLPHYVERFKWIGVPHVQFLPLAFEKALAYARVEITDLHHQGKTFTEGELYERARDLDIGFVGGVGERAFWLAGTMMLDVLAGRFGDRMHWYGYGLGNLRPNSPLRSVYRGEAWGNTMYDVYSRSKVVVNRHGEIAEGFANNLRLYEATGMGALLITEAAPNLESLFPHGVVTYSGTADLVDKVDYYLAHDSERQALAAIGQARTLEHHTYAQRMPIVSDLLQSLII